MASDPAKDPAVQDDEKQYEQEEKESRESPVADVEKETGPQSNFEKARLSIGSEKQHHDLAYRIRQGVSGQDVDDVQEGQVFSMSDIDPALDAKMRLVNQVRRHCRYIR
jgi:hypothetical protein